jgi:hypothetical protein
MASACSLQARSHTVLPAYLDAFGSGGADDPPQLITTFASASARACGGGSSDGAVSPVWVATAGGSLWGADKRARTAAAHAHHDVAAVRSGSGDPTGFVNKRALPTGHLWADAASGGSGDGVDGADSGGGGGKRLMRQRSTTAPAMATRGMLTQTHVQYCSRLRVTASCSTHCTTECCSLCTWVVSLCVPLPTTNEMR